MAAACWRLPPYAIRGRRFAAAERGQHAGSLRSHARQARPDHGGRQQPVDRLGHRQGLPRAGRRARFTYQGDALKKRVEPLAAEVGGLVAGHCDVTDPATIDAVFAHVAAEVGPLDFLVHAIAFSDKDELTGRYVDTTADNFTKTMLITCYSFTAIAQRAEKLMPHGGSLLTLTYYGAEKWMPHYNVMGVAKAALEASVRYLAADLGAKNIRVNAISAGPIKTLAASGIGDFRYILKWNELQRAAAPHRDHRGGRRHRGLSPLRPVARRHRRNPPRRCRLSHRRHEASRRARHRGRQGMSRDCIAIAPCRSPSLYYVRHGQTDWNVAAAAAGPARRSAQSRTAAAQAVRCGEILRDLFARDGRAPADFVYVSSPLGRARETMELVRATLGLPADGYAVEPRLAEISFGDWEGLTYADVHHARRRRRRQARERQVGLPAAGRRELRAGHGPRRRLVRRARPRHRRRRPWRHRAGAARAPRASRRADDATHQPIDQGVVYVYADNRLARLWRETAGSRFDPRLRPLRATHHRSGRIPCRTTPSAICSASPPGARATGRRSAAWSTAARRASR